MSNLKVSAWLDASWPTADLIAIANEAEQADFHGIWLADHFMGNTNTSERSDEGMHECFALLAALAVTVPRVRLGALVAGITYRNPAVLAKTATTIDHLGDGRLVLGVGTGWQINEHEAYGIELGTVRERIDRFEEGLHILRGLTTQPRTTVEGTYFSVIDAPLEPKPVQSPLPILIGASGEKRMLGIVAALADEWNCWSTTDSYAAKVAAMDEHCARIGRDPKSLWRTTQAPIQFGRLDATNMRHAPIGGSVDAVVDVVSRWHESGLNEWIVPGLGATGYARETFERVMSEVVPQLR